MLENGQRTYFAETFNQLDNKLSLELNVIDTKQFCLQKMEVNTIELGIKKDPMGSENVKTGGQLQGVNP